MRVLLTGKQIFFSWAELEKSAHAFVRAPPSSQKLRSLFFIMAALRVWGGSTEGRKTQKLDLVWHFSESSVSVLQTCEPLVLRTRCGGKPVQNNYCYAFWWHVLIKEGSSLTNKEGRKRRRLWKNAFFSLLWHWVMNQPGYICVIIAGTGEHQNSYSPVPVSDSGIHLTRHQHLHLSCSFPVVEERNFPSSCYKTRLGNWQLRWVCLHQRWLKGNKISPSKVFKGSKGTWKETLASSAFPRSRLFVAAALTWLLFLLKPDSSNAIKVRISLKSALGDQAVSVFDLGHPSYCLGNRGGVIMAQKRSQGMAALCVWRVASAQGKGCHI